MSTRSTGDGVIFESVADYLGSCKTLDARIAALNALIDKMLITSVAAAESGHLEEYWFDDGHVKIRSKYRNVAQMEAAITGFQRLLDLYTNRKTGRHTRLMDQSNFTGRNRW
jgi:inhibitor of KinA sporulation pathway (predicted exonuclease)